MKGLPKVSELKVAESRFTLCCYTLVLIAALLTITKVWKPLERLLTDEWMNKMWYIPTMEHHSALQKKEILTYAITWVNLEDMVLSERSRSQKDNHRVTSRTWRARSRQNHRDRKCRVVDWGLGAGGEMGS